MGVTVYNPASATNSSLTVNQTGHGFSSGNAIYNTGSAWVLAESNSSSTLGTALAVVIDANNFIAYFSGYVAGLSGLTAGQYYFVSDSLAGALTSTEPTSTSSYSNPLLFALSTTTGIVLPFRPAAIGSGLTSKVVTETTNYVASAGDFVLCDTSAGGFTVTLPLSAANGTKTVTIKKTSGDTNTVTIGRTGSDLIDGQTSQSITAQYATLQATADGASGWAVMVDAILPAATKTTLGAIHLPSVTVYTTGSGTYTTPAGATMLHVRAIGGGAGGTGSGANASGIGGAGGNTTFGPNIVAGGGSGSNSLVGGPGGTASGGDINIHGNAGGSDGPTYGNEFTGGAPGGAGPLGGAGQGGYAGAGQAGSGPGAGGGGGGITASTAGLFLGAGGGAGGYVEAWITNPSASYAYSVGGGGTAGAAQGASGTAGGAGAAGIIIIEAF